MRTQVIIHPDAEPTLDDIEVDRQLFLNPNLTDKQLKHKFLSKIGASTLEPSTAPLS